MRTLSDFTRWVLILQTHYATTAVSAATKRALSELVTHEGNVGRWLPEYPEDADDEFLVEHPWASYGNYKSFWMKKRYLLPVLRDVEFSPPYEQFDLSHQCRDGSVHRDTTAARTWHTRHRGLSIRAQPRLPALHPLERVRQPLFGFASLNTPGLLHTQQILSAVSL
jgi:hypothetical protein